MSPEEDPRSPHGLVHQPSDVSGEAADTLQPAQLAQLLLRRPSLGSGRRAPARRLWRPTATSQAPPRGTEKNDGDHLQRLAHRVRDFQGRRKETHKETKQRNVRKFYQ